MGNLVLRAGKEGQGMGWIAEAHIVLTPDEYAEFSATCSETMSSPPPALEVVLEDDEGEFVFMGLRCPHCETKGVTVIEVDVAERWNQAEPDLTWHVVAVDGVGQRASVETDGSRLNPTYIAGGQLVLNFATGQGDYHHHQYRCGSCEKPVSLPKDVEKQETWQ